MAERQQDLAKYQPDRKLALGTNPFSTLTLQDLYGRFTLKPGTRIVTDIPYDRNEHTRIDRDLSSKIAARYEIPHISSWSAEWKRGPNGGNGIENPRLVISVGMGRPETVWAPHVWERGALAALGKSITQHEKPLVLDIGCGAGYTSGLLSADGNMQAVGIDPKFSKYGAPPYAGPDVTLKEADIFDVIGEYGPRRSDSDLREINEILGKIRGSFKGKEDMYFWGMQHGFGLSYGNFDADVARLQQIAGNYDQQSPIDIALCSFMATGTDLTLAIRDGIRPKAIVYVMPTNGLAGVGNYYGEEASRRSDKGLENRVISFNPGRSYRTLAKWETFWADTWTRVAYGINSIHIEKAEVVVQVRNDVQPKPASQLPVVETYGWDEEIMDIVARDKNVPKGDLKRSNLYEGIKPVTKFALGGRAKRFTSFLKMLLD